MEKKEMPQRLRSFSFRYCNKCTFLKIFKENKKHSRSGIFCFGLPDSARKQQQLKKSLLLTISHQAKGTDYFLSLSEIQNHMRRPSQAPLKFASLNHSHCRSQAVHLKTKTVNCLLFYLQHSKIREQALNGIESKQKCICYRSAAVAHWLTDPIRFGF